MASPQGGSGGVALPPPPRQCRGHVEKIPPARRARHLHPPVARHRAGRNLVGRSARDRGGARDFASGRHRGRCGRSDGSRKSGGKGTSVSVGGERGGRRVIKKKK